MVTRYQMCIQGPPLRQASSLVRQGVECKRRPGDRLGQAHGF